MVVQIFSACLYMYFSGDSILKGIYDPKKG